ncbi:MAG: hypothetical protein LBT19_00075 [Candidatus Nomurabacteria bacterium]|jgi:hypothetical protein|nr:hypothetical protein [Candidatus Nomurabacteria bacterium]
MANENIEQFTIPQEADYNIDDAYEYYGNEKQYDGTQIPEETLSKDTKESIDRIKKREVKLGMKGLRAAMFSDAA